MLLFMYTALSSMVVMDERRDRNKYMCNLWSLQPKVLEWKILRKLEIHSNFICVYMNIAGIIQLEHVLTYIYM